MLSLRRRRELGTAGGARERSEPTLLTGSAETAVRTGSAGGTGTHRGQHLGRHALRREAAVLAHEGRAGAGIVATKVRRRALHAMHARTHVRRVVRRRTVKRRHAVVATCRHKVRVVRVVVVTAAVHVVVRLALDLALDALAVRGVADLGQDRADLQGGV